MIAKLEKDVQLNCVAFPQDTYLPIVPLTELTPAGEFKERNASKSIRSSHPIIWNDRSHVRWSPETELRIVLTTLLNSKSAEPFLCDDSDHGLLGLRTINQRLDEGKYADAKLFWSDIDECCSICSSSGRHPFMVWEMRTLFQQFEEDLSADGFLNDDDVSLALRSSAIPTFVLEDMIKRCPCNTSGTRPSADFVVSFASHLVHQPVQMLVHQPLDVLGDMLCSTKTSLLETACCS